MMLKMLSGLKDKLFSPQAPSAKGDLHMDIHGRQIPGAEVFFYPQQIRGVPVFDIDSVLQHYRADLKKLERFLPIGDHQLVNGRKVFDVMYMDVIKRFAEYVHLIPASEDHHHRGPGGLLIHSIEAAFNALSYAENKKYERSGFLDIDREMSVRARYATWVGGLLHDTGKILRDLHVDAVDVILNPRTGTVTPARNVPTWLPHMQTLIEWAKEHKVASYTVSFVRNRKHNRHNVESSHLLPYILGRDYAMKYLVDTPGANLYSELNNLLSGLETAGYISRAVREGDALSTAKDMTVYYDAMLGVKTMSVGSRVCVLMKLAKTDWQWNTPGGCGWIIGGDCYIQWPSAIDSIIKASVKHGMAIPHERMALVDLMENHGLIKPYSAEQRSLKFTKGQFGVDDANAIASGQKEVNWEELIRVTWDGHLFGDDPKPNNCKGLMFLSESGEYIFIDRMGNAKLMAKGAQPEKTGNTKLLEAPMKTSTAPASQNAPAATNLNQEAKPKASTKAATTKPQSVKKPGDQTAQSATEQSKDQAPAKATEPQTVSEVFDTSALTEDTPALQTKGIIFTRRNKPEQQNPEEINMVDVAPAMANKNKTEAQGQNAEPVPEQIDAHQHLVPEPAEQNQASVPDVHAKAVVIPPAIQALLDKGAAAWRYKDKYFLEIGQASEIGQPELKAIKSQHLSTETGTVLAQKYTFNDKTMIAAALKLATGQRLEAAGLVKLIADATHTENPTDKPGKPETVKPAHKDNPTVKSKDHRVFTVGTLGWILVSEGIDTAQDSITFEKALIKKAHEKANKRLKWSWIEKAIKEAGYTPVIAETTITVTADALNTAYWINNDE